MVSEFSEILAINLSSSAPTKLGIFDLKIFHANLGLKKFSFEKIFKLRPALNLSC